MLKSRTWFKKNCNNENIKIQGTLLNLYLLILRLKELDPSFELRIFSNN